MSSPYCEQRKPVHLSNFTIDDFSYGVFVEINYFCGYRQSVRRCWWLTYLWSLIENCRVRGIGLQKEWVCPHYFWGFWAFLLHLLQTFALHLYQQSQIFNLRFLLKVYECLLKYQFFHPAFEQFLSFALLIFVCSHTDSARKVFKPAAECLKMLKGQNCRNQHCNLFTVADCFKGSPYWFQSCQSQHRRRWGGP